MSKINVHFIHVDDHVDTMPEAIRMEYPTDLDHLKTQDFRIITALAKAALWDACWTPRSVKVQVFCDGELVAEFT